MMVNLLSMLIRRVRLRVRRVVEVLALVWILILLMFRLSVRVRFVIKLKRWLVRRRRLKRRRVNRCCSLSIIEKYCGSVCDESMRVSSEYGPFLKSCFIL